MPKDKSEGSFKPNGFLLAGICFVVALGLGIGIGWMIWAGNNKRQTNEQYWAPPIPPGPPGPEFQPSNPERMEHVQPPPEQESSNRPTFVLFSQPHCPACQGFVATWEQLKAELEQSPIALLKIEDSESLSKNNISGIPTMRLYPEGYVNGSNKFVNFQGERKKENIVQFIQEIMTKFMEHQSGNQQAPPPSGQAVNVQQPPMPGQGGMQRQYKGAQMQ